MARQRTEISFEGLHRPLGDISESIMPPDSTATPSEDIVPVRKVTLVSYTFRIPEASLQRARDLAATLPDVNIQDVARHAFDLGLQEIARKAGM